MVSSLNSIDWLLAAFWQTVLSNVTVAMLLATVALLVGWRLRRPALAHGLWVIVLIKLITPPILSIPVPAPEWMNFAPAFFEDSINIEIDRKHIETDAFTPILAASLPQQEQESEESRATPTTSLAQVNQQSNTSNKTDSGVWYQPKTFLFAVVLIWLTTSMSLMIRSLLRVIRFGRVLNVEGTSSDEASALGQQIAESLGIKNCPQIKFVSASLSPMLFGFGRSTCIVVPSGLWNELTVNNRRALLAHELSHYQRGDHWVRALELIIGSFYFWFPLVWYARGQIERMEETCCDLKAVHALESDRRLYAESLLHVVDYISQRGGKMPGLASGMRPTLTLEERLRSIMLDGVSGNLTAVHRRYLATVACIIVLIHPLATPTKGANSASRFALSANELSATDVQSSSWFSNSKKLDKDGAKPNRTRSELPPVPTGWWTPNRSLDARIALITKNSKLMCRFVPGAVLEVSVENSDYKTLNEKSPTAIVMLEQTGAMSLPRLIVGNAQGDIRVWDLESYSSVSWIGSHQAPITSLCYHPRFGLLSGDKTGLVLQWEIQSGAIVNSWSSVNGSIQSIRCNADGQQIGLLTGGWELEIPRSNITFLETDRWQVESSSELPLTMGALYHDDQGWKIVDWSGQVFSYETQSLFGQIQKSDVAPLVFSQDAVIPEVTPVVLVELPPNETKDGYEPALD